MLKEDLPNRDLSAQETKEIVNLSLENINFGLLPKLPGISFALFNRKQLKEKIKTGFLYYAFGHFKIRNSKVSITFGRYFENIQGRASYSDVFTYEFKKVKGRWKGEVIDTSSSIS